MSKIEEKIDKYLRERDIEQTPGEMFIEELVKWLKKNKRKYNFEITHTDEYHIYGKVNGKEVVIADTGGEFEAEVEVSADGKSIGTATLPREIGKLLKRI